MSTAVEKREETGQEIVAAPARALAFANVLSPAETIRRVTDLANEIKKVIEAQSLYSDIKGRRHVKVEGWTMAGSLVGVFAILVDCEPCVIADRKNPEKFHHGFTAFVEARTLDGEVVGAARSYCMRSEKTWEPRDDFALASMAQTRATSKALRQPLGFIMTMAGYDAAPEEEMPRSARGRVDRMLKRVGELCIEIDRTLGAPQGTTWGVVEEEALHEFERRLDHLGEEDMMVLGTALGHYAAKVKEDPDARFAIYDDSEIFAEEG
jgi:hypothetical protein